MVGYSDKYLSVLSLHWNSRDIDRQFLSDLERPVWDSIATSITGKLTDAVIEEGTGRLPRELHELDGTWLEETLKRRRNTLPKAASDFYKLLARNVEVPASDEAETVQISEGAGGYIRHRCI